jgi:glycosyltransferase involved in cell wall biosynthesis
MDNLDLFGNVKTVLDRPTLEQLSPEQLPPVSVVIPSYRDADLLRRCLEALSKQTYPSEKVEIIVVDNAGDEAVRQVCQEFGVTYTIEMRPGVAAARNHGIVKANHEMLAFTDSDVIPLPEWLDRGVRRFCGTENCGFVAGAVEIFTQGRPSPSLAEIYEVVMAFPVRMYMEKHGFGVHANLFTSASVLKRVGPLDPNLAGAEDWEWGQRFAGEDLVVTYDDDVRVLHPARQTIAQLVKKSRRATLGYCQWNPGKTKKLRFIIYHFALLGTFRRRCPERMRQFGLRQRSAIYALASYLQWVAAIECSRILLTGRTKYRP